VPFSGEFASLDTLTSRVEEARHRQGIGELSQLFVVTSSLTVDIEFIRTSRSFRPHLCRV
jgi:hypothetical protein